MRIRVRFFAKHREVVGRGEETYMVAEGSTLGAAIGTILGRHPELKAMIRGSVYAVNQELAAKAAKLEEGDEVAILPPVSGG